MSLLFFLCILLIPSSSAYTITRWTGSTQCIGTNSSLSIPDASCSTQSSFESTSAVCSLDRYFLIWTTYRDNSCNIIEYVKSYQTGICVGLSTESVMYSCAQAVNVQSSSSNGISAFIIVWAIFVPLCIGFVVVCLVVNRWNRSRQFKQPPPHIESIQL